VDVQERCSYEPHPARPDEWTLFRQETTIRCAPLAAVAARLAELVERRSLFPVSRRLLLAAR
jgi:hypothetical protein